MLLEILRQVLDVVLHLNVHLSELTQTWGVWIYLILFMIIFCETGLIVMPFLPGDSLLFAVGAIAALPNSGIDVFWITPLLFVAAVAGDALNYRIGFGIGSKARDPHRFKWINQAHLHRTEEFFHKHGGKTIVLARFVPIVRTFAPFVAGIGKMKYRSFATYNFLGAVFWVVGLIVAGFVFGNLPSVQRNFHVVIFGIIGVSFMPLVVEFVLQWRAKRVAAR